MNDGIHIRRNNANGPARNSQGKSSLFFQTSLFIQPKLTINRPNDIYEQEADAVAEKVMRMPDTKIAPAFFQPGYLSISSLQKKCAQCEEEEKVQMKGETAVKGGMTAPSVVNDVINSNGQHLDRGTRDFMESRFGCDFSDVKIHNEPLAHQSSKDINALAYTHGDHVIFGSGQYQPNTNSGKQLLAHELTHVIQQKSLASGSKSPGLVQRQPLPDFKISPRQLDRLIGSEIIDGFALESHTLTENHKGRLNVFIHNLLDLLGKYPGGIIRIVGHTDATGEGEYNFALGQRRADEVKKYMSERGIPPASIITLSEGENSLRVATGKQEPLNRRVQINFLMPSFGKPASPSHLTPPEFPEHKEPERQDTTRTGISPGPSSCGSITDCFASSNSPFAEQPAFLRDLVKRSFPDVSESQWFEQTLNLDLRGGLVSIYNRFCTYKLLCFLKTLVKVEPGAPDALIKFPFVSHLPFRFKAPGKTISVFFTTGAPTALIDTLLQTGKFCVAGGLGGTMHPGQTSLREISTSDSLHVSVGPGNRIDAHIDKYSPVTEHPGGIFCPDEPTPAATGHIGRELVPEIAEGKTGISGFQIFPEPIFPEVGAPPAPRGSEPPPIVAGITLYGPERKPQKRKTDVPILLPDDIHSELVKQIPTLIKQDALIPPGAVKEYRDAFKAADFAGPDEERILIKKRDDAKAKLDSFADAHEFALDMAIKMGEAKRQGVSGFVVNLGINYQHLSDVDKKYIVGQIIQMARVLRAFLKDRASGLYKISIIFGTDKQEVTF